MESVLNKTVSVLRNYSDTKPYNYSLIAFLTDESYKEEISQLRSVVDESEQKRLKALLPAAHISGTFKSRGECGLIEHSGLIQFDIDHVDDLNAIYKLLTEIPYTAYCAKSARGRGYFGIFAITNKAKHREHFKAMQLYFQSIGITIDPAPSNVASLRGYTFDEGAYFNHNPTLFNLIYEVPIVTKKPFRIYHNSATGDNPFNDFNDNGNIEDLLISHGWTYQHTKGTRKRFSRPGKESGVSADYCIERKLLYVFSSDPATEVAEAQRAYNNVSIFCQLECNNNWSTCAKRLKEMGFGLAQ